LQVVSGLSAIGFAFAGFLVGFGTKLGNGCTSGHGNIYFKYIFQVFADFQDFQKDLLSQFFASWDVELLLPLLNIILISSPRIPKIRVKYRPLSPKLCLI
jgi:hypothetical protein